MFRRACVPSGVLLCSAAAPAAAAKPDTRKLIQELRARTDAPILDCKKALTECGADDLEKCVAWLKAKGVASADKKLTNRETTVGLVSVAVSRRSDASPLGAFAFQLCCETDFSARNERFQQLAAELGAAAEKLIQDGAWDPLRTEANCAEHFRDQIKSAMVQIGENITVKRAVPLELGAANQVGVYTHGSISAAAPNAGSMLAVSFIDAGADASPSSSLELATDIAQTCVANFYADGVAVPDFVMMGQEKTVKEHCAEKKAALRRVYMLSTASDVPRDLLF